MNKIIQLLADKIAKQQCVLFVGPGIFKDTPEADYSIYETFAMSLAEEMRKENFRFDETQHTNIYYIVPRYRLFINSGGLQSLNMTDIRNRFVEYSRSRILNNSLFKDLSSLPFRIIINTNPDEMIRMMMPAGQRIVFSYYDISNNSVPDPDSRPPYVLTKEDFRGNATIVYNLFGSYDNNNSLLLTEDELLEYNVRLNQHDTRISSELTNKFDENKYYLFLGFQFDQWLLKIVVKALGLPKGDRITYTIPAQSPPEYQQHFYEDQFKFFFVDKNNPQYFLMEVKAEFKKIMAKPTKSDDVAPPRQLKMVLLYHSNMDGESADILGFYIKPLRDSKRVWIWSEKFLEADDEKESGIVDNLMDADIIIPLITAEMVGECGNQLTLLQRVFEQRKQKPPAVRPILLRDFDYTSIPFLCDFPWSPINAKEEVQAVRKWPNDAEAYTKISFMLGELIKKMN